MTGATVLLPLPVVAPLLGAAGCLLLNRLSAAQRAVSLGALVATLVDTAVLLVLVDRSGPTAVQLGGWPAPLGITLVADRLATLPLAASGLVLLAVLGYSIGQRMRDQERSEPGVFHPAYLGLAAGVNLAFLSGDLFNLFVGLELMLASSYVLITLAPSRPRVRAGMTYLGVSLAASILLLTAVAACYGATGTVSLAQLGQRIPELPPGTRGLLGMLLLVVFGVKAAIVPLHMWLPDSYPAALTKITAVFAALLTKVAVYALIRTQTLLFPQDGTSWLWLVLALVTMLVGIVGALAQEELNRLLSFALVSHVGFMLFGLALWSAAGVRGAILYLVHHIFVQAALFLVVGLVEAGTGTAPAVATLFLVAGLSLSGIPPLSGFVAKLALFQAGVGAGGAAGYALTAGAVTASLLTLVVVSRVWNRWFWADRAVPRPAGGGGHRVMVGATASMVAAGVAVAVLAGPLATFATRAADDLLTRTPYQTAVLDGRVP